MTMPPEAVRGAVVRCVARHRLPSWQIPCAECVGIPPAHTCAPPDLSTWEDYDEDWKCPECGQDWFVGYLNYCHSCYRSDGRQWERYGTGDGGFPLVQARRGGIRFEANQAPDAPGPGF